MINTTPCSVLPRHMTPYEVFFGRKPRFDIPFSTQNTDLETELGSQSEYSLGSNSDIDNDDSEGDEPEEIEEDLITVLIVLEQRVFKKNIKVNIGYAKRGGISKAVFQMGDIVTLAVEKKRRVVGKLLRLPCRIVGIEAEKYSLLSALG